MVNIVLLPGMLCDADYWQDQIEALSEVAQVSVADYPDMTSFSQMAKGVLENAPPRFCAIGHSMGGRVALEILRQAPDRVDAICLCGADYAGPADDAARIKEREAADAQLAGADASGFDAFAQNWARSVVAPDHRADTVLIDRIVDMVVRSGRESLAAQLGAANAREDYAQLLQQISIPASVIGGELDVHRPPQHQQHMAQQIPGAACTIVSGSGHMLSMEVPDAVNTAMLSWMAGW